MSQTEPSAALGRRAAARAVAVALLAGMSEASLWAQPFHEPFDSFAAWTDISTVVGAPQKPIGDTAFTTPGGVLQLVSGVLGTGGLGATELRSYQCLDRQLSTPVIRREEILTIEYRLRWDVLNSTSQERGRWMLVLNYDYPAGGLNLIPEDMPGSDYGFTGSAGNAWARPAYQVRHRAGNSASIPGHSTFLQYGGGLTDLGEYEASGTLDAWLPGFISSAGGGSPGNNPPTAAWPLGDYVATPGSVASTSFQRFRLISHPDRIELWRNQSDDGMSFSLILTLPTPDVAPPTLPASELFRYFEQVEGIRLFWGNLRADSNVFVDYLTLGLQPTLRGMLARQGQTGFAYNTVDFTFDAAVGPADLATFLATYTP